MTQLYIYIYPHISSLLHLPPSHPPYPTPLGGHKAQSWSPCAMRLAMVQPPQGVFRSRRRGVRDWVAPWVWGQKDQGNWWLQGTLFRIYWILYRQKRNSLLDNNPMELLIVSVQSLPQVYNNYPWTSSSLNQAHTQPPAIRNNQDSQFPEVSWLEIALLISFTFLRPGKKSAFQGKGFAFCDRHTVSSRSYLRLRLHASHTAASH